MNRKCLLAVFFFLSTTTFLLAIDSENIYTSSVKSVVVIYAKKAKADFVGTGFFSFSSDMILTCYHLVKNSSELQIKDSSGNSIKAIGIVDFSERFDLALLKCENKGHTPLAFEPDLPSIGSKLYAIGCPKGLEFSLSDGIVSQIRNLGEGNQIQFTCPTSPGNSGGPILNSEGKIVGIVSWQYIAGQNLNFAVPISLALSLNRQNSPKSLVENETIIPTSPNDSISAKEHYEKAIEYYEKGLYEAAIKENTIAIQKDPKNVEILNNLANSYFKVKQPKNAIEIWEMALKETIDQKISNTGKISNNLGIAYYQLMDYENAEKFYLQSIKADKDFEDPLFNLASLYGFQRKFEKAINLYKKFISITKDPKMKKEAQEKLNYCRRQR